MGAENHESFSPDERLTDEEVRSVVALWANEQSEGRRERLQPRLRDVAEGLEIEAEEAARLLRQVRPGHASQIEEHPLKRATRQHIDADGEPLKADMPSVGIITRAVPVLTVFAVILLAWRFDPDQILQFALPCAALLAGLFILANKASEER